MFITMPIKTFLLEGNSVRINNTLIEYEEISDDTREILESLITKGAYGSALLTLNMFYNVKSINESSYTQEDYISYLGECNKLMEECTIETEARNFRPLVNLNGLEIMESANHIARGKGGKLLIEDFRKKHTLKEQDITMPDSPEDGWGDDIADLTEEFFDYVDRAEYEIRNARRGSYADIGEDIEGLARSFEYIASSAEQLAELLRNAEVNYSSDDDYELEESAEGTQCSDIAPKKDQEVGSLQKPKKPKKHFTESALLIPKNHGFKGFRLTESGTYERGNYILVNKNGKIKAINKNSI